MRCARAMLVVWAMSCQMEDHLSEERSSLLSINTTVVRTTEDPLLEIAIRHPTFGGYLCEGNDLVVLSTSSDLAELVNEIETRGAKESCFNRLASGETRIVTRLAAHSFLQLRSWRDAIVDPFFELDVASALGIDYQANRLQIFVTSQTPQVDTLAQSLGIPATAYAISVEPPTVQQLACPDPADGTHIQFDCFRPVPAGVQIRARTSNSSFPTTCTLGATSDRYMTEYSPPFWQAGFVTNSHCMPGTWTMDSLYMNQPSENEQMIGFEFVDPPGWQCGSRICRNSDAAWAWAYNAWPQYGRIARLSYWDGSLTVPGSHPRWYIYSVIAPVQGMLVEKSGRTTGWTWGNIQYVCIDVAASDNRRLNCQSRANYFSDSGDSGSPVFQWPTRVWNDSAVRAVGMHWGRGDYATFSPWAQVQADLGSLYLLYPGY